MTNLLGISVLLSQALYAVKHANTGLCQPCICNAGAVEAMQQSSAEAAACLRRHGATGCTDVTGFGLLGHLAEMTRASQVCAALQYHSQAGTCNSEASSAT